LSNAQNTTQRTLAHIGWCIVGLLSFRFVSFSSVQFSLDSGPHCSCYCYPCGAVLIIQSACNRRSAYCSLPVRPCPFVWLRKSHCTRSKRTMDIRGPAGHITYTPPPPLSLFSSSGWQIKTASKVRSKALTRPDGVLSVCPANVTIRISSECSTFKMVESQLLKANKF